MSTERYIGKGYPDGELSGTISKVQKLVLEKNDGLFSGRYKKKIVVADNLFTIDGESLKIAGNFLNKRIAQKTPRALILRQNNWEFLAGLIASHNQLGNIPFFCIWDLKNSDFFREIKNDDTLQIKVRYGKAIIRKYR